MPARAAQVARAPEPAAARRRARWTAEHRFFLGFALAALAVALLGFSRSFFLRPVFADWARAHSPPETFFYIHGLVMSAWLVLLVAQPWLAARRRIDLHRRLGTAGAVLAAAIVAMGLAAGAIAASRPSGFVGIPLPPLVFLVVPVSSTALFGGFALIGLLRRNDPQSHKRLMLLATLGMLDAAFARLPFDLVFDGPPLPPLVVAELGVAVLLGALVVWDLASRRRIHAVTFWGGLVLLAVLRLRIPLAGSDPWLSFATWYVGRFGA